LVAAVGRVLQEGAPRTASMRLWASQCGEGSHFQDACWRHAEWTRTQSGKNSSYACGNTQVLW
jgi:hypothetical protein